VQHVGEAEHAVGDDEPAVDHRLLRDHGALRAGPQQLGRARPLLGGLRVPRRHAADADAPLRRDSRGRQEQRAREREGDGGPGGRGTERDAHGAPSQQA
jgi:hypothetical protein